MVVTQTDYQMEWITPEEKELVKELRTRVWCNLPSSETSESEEDQDAFLLRWIRARDLNVDKAEGMLLNAIEWRKKNRMNEILEQPVDPFFDEEYIFSYPEVTDKLGQPVLLIPGCTWDFRKIAEHKKEDGFELFINKFMESIQNAVSSQNRKRKHGQPPVTQILMISDLKGFPYGQMLSWAAMKKFCVVAGLYEAYYPELLFKLICVNTPWFFPAFLRLLSGIFAPKTLGKFILYTSLEEWRKDVENYIDPSVLPEEYGGILKETNSDETRNN